MPEVESWTSCRYLLGIIGQMLTCCGYILHVYGLPRCQDPVFWNSSHCPRAHGMETKTCKTLFGGYHYL